MNVTLYVLVSQSEVFNLIEEGCVRSQRRECTVSVVCVPLQAIWSRCFPVHAEVRRLLAEKAVGEVKLVKAYFGSPQLHIPRSVEKELGGGALLDIGVYCLQFVLMVFNGERPESIHANGVLLESGTSHPNRRSKHEKRLAEIVPRGQKIFLTSSRKF